MTLQMEGKTMNGKTTIEPNYGTTILRVALGVVLLFHGLMKVFVFTISGTNWTALAALPITPTLSPARE